MNNFTQTLISLAFCLLAFTPTKAQTQLANCDANTQADGSGQAINIGLQAVVTVQPVVTNCRFQLALVIGTVDGLNAMNDVNVNVGITAGGTTIAAPTIFTLPGGQPSITIPLTFVPILVCDVVFVMTVQVVGGSGCMDDAFFPVELTNFQALSNENQQIQLTWETASETKNQGFEIERSREGKKWEMLDFVKGAGTTLETQTYAWTDSKPYTQDLNYYRLKQLDFDGTTEYSSIIVAEIKSKLDKIVLSPNPASEFLNLQLGEIKKEARIEIYNSSNQLVKSLIAPKNSSSIDLNISDLPNSIYWIIISSGNARAQEKFVKL